MIRLPVLMLLAVFTACVHTACIYEPEDRKQMSQFQRDYYNMLDQMSGKLHHSKFAFVLEAASRVVISKISFQKRECDQLMGWLNTCSWRHKFLVAGFSFWSVVTFGINIRIFGFYKRFVR